MTGSQTDLPFSRPTFRPTLAPKPAEPQSLRDAQETFHVQLNKDGEASCPCCRRNSRKYPRALNSGMARTLVWLVRRWEVRRCDWIDVQATAPAFVLRSNEIGKLAAWGLAEQLPSEERQKRRSGSWRPTQLGRDFVHRRVKVQSHAVFYNSEIEQFTGEPITICKALGKRFDYNELMTGEVL